jgi:hypothetical protein
MGEPLRKTYPDTDEYKVVNISAPESNGMQ